MTRFLTLDELVNGAQAVLGDSFAIRDLGLLESALARPQTTVFGDDAYPSFHEKAAALLHSLVNNHALVDGNKRTAFVATVVFARLNDHDAQVADEEDWFRLLLDVAKSNVSEISEIAERLAVLLRPTDGS